MENAYDKLTDSAKAALKDFCSEYEERLLTEAYSSAECHHTEDQEISLRDIIEARARIEKGIEKKGQRVIAPNRFVFFTMTTLSLFLAVVGVISILMESRFYGSLRPRESPGLMAVAFGLILLILSFYYYGSRSGLFGMNKIERGSRRVVSLWEKIEDIGKQMMDKGFADKNHFNITQLMNTIHGALQDAEDDEKLRKILKVRNTIIRGSSDSLSLARIKETIAMEYDIIEKLKRNLD